MILINESYLTLNTSFKIPGNQIYLCDHPHGIVHPSSVILIKSVINCFYKQCHMFDKRSANRFIPLSPRANCFFNLVPGPQN